MKFKKLIWLQNSYGEEDTICYCGNVCIGYIDVKKKSIFPLIGKYATNAIAYSNIDDARQMIECSFTEFINQFLEGD
jgi:hypothetical protein